MAFLSALNRACFLFWTSHICLILFPLLVITRRPNGHSFSSLLLPTVSFIPFLLGLEGILCPFLLGHGSLSHHQGVKCHSLKNVSFGLGAPTSACWRSFWLAGLPVGNHWIFLLRMATPPLPQGCGTCSGHSG